MGPLVKTSIFEGFNSVTSAPKTAILANPKRRPASRPLFVSFRVVRGRSPHPCSLSGWLSFCDGKTRSAPSYSLLTAAEFGEPITQQRSAIALFNSYIDAVSNAQLTPLPQY